MHTQNSSIQFLTHGWVKLSLMSWLKRVRFISGFHIRFIRYIRPPRVFLCSSVVHLRMAPGVAWGWTSPCSAASTSWRRSWFPWRWARWHRWWVGPRAWCTLRVWCRLWAACIPRCVWCTTCHRPRVSLPWARPNRYWCTFRSLLSHCTRRVQN